jgi:hypothetical protein
MEATEISITPIKHVKNKQLDKDDIESSIRNKQMNVNESIEEVKYNKKYEGYARRRYEEKCADDNYKEYNYKKITKKEESGNQSKVFKTYEEFLATMNIDDTMKGRVQPKMTQTLIRENQELLRDEALKQERNRLEAKQRQKKREIDELKRKAKQKEKRLKYNFIIRKLQNLYKKLVLRKNLSTIHKIAMKVRNRRIAGRKVTDAMYQWYEKKKQKKLLHKYINHCASIIQNQYRNYRRVKLIYNRYINPYPKEYKEKLHDDVSYEIKRDEKLERRNSQDLIYEDMYIGMTEEPARQQLPVKVDTKSTAIQHVNSKVAQINDRPIKSLGQNQYNIEEALALDNVNQEVTKKTSKKHCFLKRKDKYNPGKVTKQSKRSGSPVERIKNSVKIPVKQLISPKITFEVDNDSSRDESNITNPARFTSKKESVDDRPVKHLGHEQYKIEEALAEDNNMQSENKMIKKKNFLKRREVYDPKKAIEASKKKSNSPPIEGRRGRSRAPQTKSSKPLGGGVGRRVLSSDTSSREETELKKNLLKRVNTKKSAREDTAPRIDCWNQSTKKTPIKIRKPNTQQRTSQTEEKQSVEQLTETFSEYHGENQSMH